MGNEEKNEQITKIKGMKKEVYNKKEIGKVGSHAIASNQNYAFNQACDKFIDLLKK